MILENYLLYEYRDLFIDMAVRTAGHFVRSMRQI